MNYFVNVMGSHKVRILYIPEVWFLIGPKDG